jgi:hypothetical protein
MAAIPHVAFEHNSHPPDERLIEHTGAVGKSSSRPRTPASTAPVFRILAPEPVARRVYRLDGDAFIAAPAQAAAYLPAGREPEAIGVALAALALRRPGLMGTIVFSAARGHAPAEVAVLLGLTLAEVEATLAAAASAHRLVAT